MAEPMLKVYGGARSRASIVLWYLEELQAPYEFVMLDMQQGEHRQQPFLSINPFGKVPAIVDGEHQVFESGAILLYLADKYQKMPADLGQRGLIYQWVLFSNATLGQGIFNEATREQELIRMLTPLERRLQTQLYLLGNEFTVVDIAVGSLLYFIPVMLPVDLSPYPAVVAYLERLKGRPAFGKGMLAGRSDS
jgi:glutathione S-transferase